MIKGDKISYDTYSSYVQQINNALNYIKHGTSGQKY